MEKEEEGYKFPSRFYILVTRKEGISLMGTQSLQGFTEQSVEKHMLIAINLPGVLCAEVIEVQSLFDQK